MTNEEALELLKKVINVETVDGNERKVAEMLAEVFEAHDIPTEVVPFTDDPDRAQLIATIEGSEPGKTIALSGHMDVVPVTKKAWKYEPFNAIEDDGILYGRGAADMKSGLIAQVASLINLKESGIPFKGTIKFIGTDAEEVGLLGAYDLADKGYADGIDAMIIGEQTSMHIARANKGVFDFKIRTSGKAAHSSSPESGVNAIDNLLLALKAIKEKLEITDVEDDILGKASISLNQISGGVSNNVVPDEAEAFIDIRTVAGQDSEVLRERIKAILDELKKLHDGFDYEYEQVYDILAVATPDDDPLLASTQKAMANHGYDDELLFIKGGTDASAFRTANKDFGMVIVGPGNALSAHQTDENVKVEDYYNAIEVYQEIVKDYLGMEE